MEAPDVVGIYVLNAIPTSGSKRVRGTAMSHTGFWNPISSVHIHEPDWEMKVPRTLIQFSRGINIITGLNPKPVSGRTIELHQHPMHPITPSKDWCRGICQGDDVPQQMSSLLNFSSSQISKDKSVQSVVATFSPYWMKVEDMGRNLYGRTDIKSPGGNP